jgi:Na+/proline symporter
VFLFGVFWPRANRHGAIASLVIGALLGAARFVFELNRGSTWVSGSPLLSQMIAVNFLHFAVIIFAVSAAVLVVVSLATQPETAAKLRGLTFKTLEGAYQRGESGVFRLHVIASVALALTVIVLWLSFA